MFCEYNYSRENNRTLNHKPGPLAAMLHTCDAAFYECCDAYKSPGMSRDRKFNMLNIFHPFLNILAIYYPIFKQFSTLSWEFNILPCDT